MYGAFGVAFLPVGLKGCFDLLMLMFGRYDGPANIPVGLLVTVGFLVLPTLFLWAAIQNGKTLVLSPDTQTAYLTKRYLSKAIRKQFAFAQIRPSTIYLDPDCSWDLDWRVRLKLPDSTRFRFYEPDEPTRSRQKALSTAWSERINSMIRKDPRAMHST
ncbi:MAG: hypothetical protein AAFO81_04350 [Pseudomonadota bacterium]